MNISMYEATVPALSLALGNLQNILKKGAEHCEANKFDEAVVLNLRLYPDMLPFSKQIQIATDMSKGCVARLSGTEAPAYEDNEESIAELIARCEKTIAYLQTITPEQINDTEDKEVTMKTPSRELKFDGLTYALKFVLPNVHFHVTTAYAILRHNGVALSKMDYVGPIV